MPLDDITIRPMTREDFDAVTDLYRRAYPGDIARRATALRWIVSENPHAKAGEEAYLLMLAGTKVVGYWGRMPTKMYFRGQPHYVLFSQEALVDPDYRRRGLATALALRAMETDHLILSLWHNEKILATLRKTGWTEVGRFRMMRRAYRAEPVAQVKFGNRRLARLLQPLVRFYFRSHGAADPRAGAVSVHTIDHFGDEFDELFEQMKSKVEVIAERSAATLNWRYVDIPHQRYTIHVARRNKELCGYAVHRVQDLEDGLRKGTIIDFLTLPGDDAAVDALLDGCSKAFQSDRVDFAVCLVSSDATQRRFVRHGYRRSGDAPERSLWAYNVERSPLPEAVQDLGHWYLTMGDSDADLW